MEIHIQVSERLVKAVKREVCEVVNCPLKALCWRDPRKQKPLKKLKSLR